MKTEGILFTLRSAQKNFVKNKIRKEAGAAKRERIWIKTECPCRPNSKETEKRKMSTILE